MTSDEIRERYLSFFEQRGHRRIPSASLVPSAHDPSALLTVAGMHPLKPYFLGHETPPAPRLTSCQKVFRTVDIDNVGASARHLTLFEMLGNFSFGDYFKRDAIGFAWELSREVFGFRDDDIWVTVFAGDDDLGLGPDEEAITCWLELGMPRERIVECPRSENFWQAGPAGPCGPCSELYIDRGLDFGAPEDLPGGENERFLEYWNLVFMQYDQQPARDGAGSTLTPLPANNIDTGLGLNRMAAILQGKSSVFDTDQFQPLIELGEELSGRAYGSDFAGDRALRILADHSRAMTFLTADGVVPSNEDRGYVLRRVMRRAIQQGLALELEPGFLTRYAQRVREIMGGAYPELIEHAQSTDMWLSAEEEGFGRTLAQGMDLLREEIALVRSQGRSMVTAEFVFRLYDTHGFPIEMTGELLSEAGLTVDGDVDALMDAQRIRSRAVVSVDSQLGFQASLKPKLIRGVKTRFTGYETELQRTTVGAVASADDSQLADGRQLVKLAESPFYPAGGGQVSDVGVIECEHGDCRARVEEVFRLGDDQALAVVVENGSLTEGEPVIARVDRAARHATEANHTATHLLHAALRERLGDHVRQAGSHVGPDKLRFDFSHSQALSAQELRDVEDRVNAWIARNDPVRPILTTLDEARKLGAMALFGEKYGDVVRMVEVGDGEYSRELCGGTHVRSTAEIGVFHVLGETSSAANVRRIEALTGPAAAELLRDRARALAAIEATAGMPAERVPAAIDALRAELRASAKAQLLTVDADALAAQAVEVGDARVLTATVDVADARALLDVLDRVRGKLPDAAIVLGAAGDGRVHLVAGVAPALVPRGLRAGEIVRTAAAVVGGGGGGRDTVAQAGGRDPAKLDQALAAARAAIEAALAGETTGSTPAEPSPAGDAAPAG